MIIQRCINPQAQDFHHYGGRGIAVCERWRSFENFLNDMGEKPSPGLTIERINNDGNYEPGNCRWATRAEQCHNTRANKINLRTAAEIRALAGTASHEAIAERYGVSQVLVSKIIRNEAWVEAF